MTKDSDRTSSQADFLANLSVSQEKENLRKMTEISGRKLIELSKSPELLGLLEKMLVESLNSISTPYLRTWKVQTTPQGALIFQLRASVRTTKGQESGLLPTPDASPRGARRNQNNHQVTLQDVVAGHTPEAQKVRKKFPKLLPTPSASEHKATKKWRKSHHNGLTAAMFNPEKLLPTPCARDYRDTTVSPSYKMRRTDSLPIVLMKQEQPKTGGKLNPNFVEYLMGYDTDYTNIEQTE